MKIYTSYFANWRHFPEDAVQVAICRKLPKGYKGLWYERIAPDYEMMYGMKDSSMRDFFAVKYIEDVLKPLDRQEVLRELEELSGGKDIVLLCYETPMDFCHRHLVAKWLGLNSLEAELGTR